MPRIWAYKISTRIKIAWFFPKNFLKNHNFVYISLQQCYHATGVSATLGPLQALFNATKIKRFIPQHNIRHNIIIWVRDHQDPITSIQNRWHHNIMAIRISYPREGTVVNRLQQYKPVGTTVKYPPQYYVLGRDQHILSKNIIHPWERSIRNRPQPFKLVGTTNQ